MPTEKSEALPTHELLYLGKTRLEGNKIGVILAWGASEGADRWYFPEKNLRKLHLTVGGRYSFEADKEKGSIRAATGKWLGWFHDKEKILEWATEAKTREAVYASEKLLKDAKRRDLFEVLEPVRRAYHRSPGSQRDVMLALIVRYVTGRT